MPSAQKSKPKKTSEKKSVLEKLDENFVFPIYSSPERRKNLNRRIINKKRRSKLSPHLLDLRNPISSENTSEVFTPPVLNSDDWFSNFKNSYPQTTYHSTRIEFEAPDHSELPTQKIEYYKPPKSKTKSSIKLNLGRGILDSLEESISLPRHQPPILLTLKKILYFILSIIFFPFRALDFIVDRTLRGIWWLIKTLVLSIFNLFKSIINKFSQIFKTKKRVKKPVNPVKSRYFIIRQVTYRPILTFALICLIIILPFQFINLKQKASGLKGHVLGSSMQGLEALKQASSLGQELNWTDANQKFDQAYFNFTLAKTYLDNLGGVSSQILRLLPEGAQANNLLILGQLGAKLGQDLTDLATQLDDQNSSDLKLIEKLSATQTTLEKIEPNLLELIQRLEDVDTQLLYQELDSDELAQLSLLQSSISLISNNFNNLKNLNSLLLNFLGKDNIKKYLVIFQNNSELRPTGGFMGSYALVEMHDGKIVKMDVPGGGFYDLKAATVTAVEAPKPFHLFSPYWQIWNANWFPDWPASAEKISKFYEKTTVGETVDGVLSLTPDVIEDLLALTGPIEMPAYGKIITAENFVPEVQMAVEFEYDPEENQPKKIIADMLPIVLDRIFDINIQTAPQFLQILNNNLKEKNVLIWFRDENMQATVQNLNWGGEVCENSGDYLMVIHTNIGGGKTDRIIENEILHNVEIDSNGNIFNNVTLTRTHNGQIGNVFEDQNNVDYVRFYVPQGSELINAEGFDFMPPNLVKTAANYKTLAKDPDLTAIEQNPVLDEKYNMRITQEFGKTCFGNWMQVKPGEEKTVSLKYKLPFKLKKEELTFWDKVLNLFRTSDPQPLRYTLIHQKQSGLKSTQFTSNLNIPPEWNITKASATGNPPEYLRNQLKYSNDLHTDCYYSAEIE